MVLRLIMLNLKSPVSMPDEKGFIAQMLPPIASTVVDAITRGGPRRQFKWNKKAAELSNQMNRQNAEWTLEQNRRIQEEQRLYDSPGEQMKRYKEAGLNPHLIYGNGSSAGSAFPISQQGIAPSRVDAPSSSYGELGSSFMRAAQMEAQTSYTSQREEESVAKTALTSLMTDIAKTNPMLNPDVANWVSTSMMEVARLKSIESRQWMTKGEDDIMKVSSKINMEVEKMSQELGLNTADLKIKNRILESKEFENAIKRIQSEWLKDGDLTPEHIRQGVMLILSKMLGR